MRETSKKMKFLKGLLSFLLKETINKPVLNGPGQWARTMGQDKYIIGKIDLILQCFMNFVKFLRNFAIFKKELSII